MALVRTVHAEQHLNRGRLLDLAGERCRVDVVLHASGVQLMPTLSAGAEQSSERSPGRLGKQLLAAP